MSGMNDFSSQANEGQTNEGKAMNNEQSQVNPQSNVRANAQPSAQSVPNYTSTQYAQAQFAQQSFEQPQYSQYVHNSGYAGQPFAGQPYQGQTFAGQNPNSYQGTYRSAAPQTGFTGQPYSARAMGAPMMPPVSVVYRDVIIYKRSPSWGAVVGALFVIAVSASAMASILRILYPFTERGASLAAAFFVGVGVLVALIVIAMAVYISVNRKRMEDDIEVHDPFVPQGVHADPTMPTPEAVPTQASAQSTRDQDSQTEVANETTQAESEVDTTSVDGFEALTQELDSTDGLTDGFKDGLAVHGDQAE